MDTSSNATLVRPDLVSVGTALEPTSAHLKTVTGDFAPIKGKGLFLFDMGGLSVSFHAWMAEVQDPCFLGLDFFKGSVRCVLDLCRDSLALPDGRSVQLTHPAPNLTPVSLPVYSADTSKHALAVKKLVCRSCKTP